MKTAKKLLVCILAIVLTAGSFSTSAYAGEEELNVFEESAEADQGRSVSDDAEGEGSAILKFLKDVKIRN